MLNSIKKSKITILLYSVFSYLFFYPSYLIQYFKFNRLTDGRFHKLSFADRYICNEDATSNTGYDFHYVYHTSWAARILAKTKPTKHIDISSSLYFNSIVSAFIPIDFYDYRPADLDLSNFSSNFADLLNLPFKTGSVVSLSCMHVVEHVGLGRYGEPIDPGADLKAIKELKRVLKRGGDLLFVVPIGSMAKIQFNAHRIYTYEIIIEYFPEFTLKEFVYISENHPEKGLQKFPTNKEINKDQYSTAGFWFKKK